MACLGRHEELTPLVAAEQKGCAIGVRGTADEDCVVDRCCLDARAAVAFPSAMPCELAFRFALHYGPPS